MTPRVKAPLKQTFVVSCFLFRPQNSEFLWGNHSAPFFQFTGFLRHP